MSAIVEPLLVIGVLALAVSACMLILEPPMVAAIARIGRLLASRG